MIASAKPTACGVVVALVGPTGAGKSALAVSLARSLDGEVIGCDALQVYRGLDIGTGKINLMDRAGVPHHLLDVVDPDVEFSAADYVRSAAPLVGELERRGKLPIIVGGTGLYLRSLRRGLFEGPGRRPEFRARIVEVAGKRGLGFVHRMLKRLDPAAATRIHRNDLVRVTRALEVIFVSRSTMSHVMSRRRSPLGDRLFVLIGLGPPRRELIVRIERRVGEMFRAGLVEEVRRLLDEYGPDAASFKAIGYREVAGYLRGALSLAEARELTIRATVQYAKRQMTWFRREEGVAWFPGCGDDPEVVRAVRKHLDSALDGRYPLAQETRYAKTAS